MAEAPTGDDKLHPDDAVNILEELLDAQNESRTFGLKLNLPVDEVEAIFTKYSDPRDRLLHIILAFLRQAEPRPTWRVIVDALRSPIVNLTALARRVEAAHFPDLAAARDVAPDTDHSQELTSKEAELTNAEETTIVNRTRQRKTQAKDRAQQQLRQKEEQLRSSESTVADLSQKKPMQGSKWRWIIVLIAAFVFFGFFILFFILPDTQQQQRQKEEQQRSSESTVADLSQKARALQPQDTKTQPGLSIPAKPRKLTVQCRRKKKAPRFMIRGSAATDGRFVYIVQPGLISPYKYESNTEEWMQLPSCPYNNSGLAIIDSELTTVGGWDGVGRTTNQLFTLRQGKWVEVYPPMNTARFNPAVVSTSDGDYLIVIGGFGSNCEIATATVELFRVKSRRWYKLKDLPQPLPQPSATICGGDQLHVIGMDGKGYSCSLQSLPSNDRPITSPLTLSWKPLPPLPVTDSTAATLWGQLVLIGGRQDRSPANSIHQLVEGQWLEIGYMTSGRWWCLAVSPSPDRILMVSGWGADDTVEECVAVKSP